MSPTAESEEALQSLSQVKNTRGGGKDEALMG